MTKKKFLALTQKNRPLLIAFVIFFSAFIMLGKNQNENSKAPAEKIYADTLIPKGFVLIPIELSNAETISSLIDQFGVIDLYAGAPNDRGSKKIASRIKILRAPLNPQQYAVLVPEHLSNSIMQVAGTFWAVVQNRQTKSDQAVAPVTKSVAIEYYKGQ